MIKLKIFFANAFFRAPHRSVFFAGFAMVVAACMQMPLNPESPTVSYQYRTDYSFVRLEHIEPGTPDNAHPFTVAPGALRQALANLQVKGTVSMRAKPVFTDKELQEIVPHLVAALAKAGPKEDVTFAVTGEHGVFGDNSPESVTTARVFVQAARLHVILGHVHELYETRKSDPVVRAFRPGSRARHIESGWHIEPVPENVSLADKRSDWLKFDLAALTAAQKEKPPASSTTKPATPADSRSQEIADKLRTLDRLKADGLITEEEYRERRKAILQAI